MDCRISLRINEKVKDIFNITYTSDGGFFFQDKIRLNFTNKECLVIKVKTDVNNHGIVNRAYDYTAFTSGDIKMAHHLDGRSHISGFGVTSGYDEGEPKGAAIKSFGLTESNDGGAFWCMSLWGFDSLRDSKKSNIVLLPDDQYVHSAHHQKDLNTFEIKAIYFLKHWFTEKQLLQRQLLIKSPIEGLVNITLIPSPSHCPGIIGLFATRGNHNFQSAYGFTMSGAPGKVDELGFCQFLSVIFPSVRTQRKGKNLDFLKA